MYHGLNFIRDFDAHMSYGALCNLEVAGPNQSGTTL
jgi:hypothetical protein